MALRTVDLARRAGISGQLVRNYEANGILPEVPRSESGYRQYAEVHVQALLTFRALLPGFGNETSTAIMCAANDGDEALVFRLVDATHAVLNEQRLATDAASEALGAAAEEFLDAAPVISGPPLLVGQLARQLGVQASSLRVWESAGLLTSLRDPGTKYRRYGPVEVRDARIINMLRRGRYGYEQIRPVLDGLRQTGSADALRAAVAERRAAHDQRTRAMIHGTALLHDYLT